MSDEPLVDKYRPTRLSECQGNNSNISELKAWLRDFSPGDEAKLLYGPPGVGKTSTVEALSNEFGVPLTEVNASDARKSADIKEFVTEAQSTPIMSEFKLVLFDEVDSMSGRSNLQPLYDYLESPENPTIFVCNDEYEVPQGIKDRVTSYKWKLGVRSRKAKLKKIVQSENIDVGASTISMLAQRENLRDAIHDLQLLMETEDGLTNENDRQYEESIFDELDRLLSGESVSLSKTPDKSMLWIDKNIRGRYRLTEAAVAWECLSLADKMNDRVWAGSGDPDYRWWKYSGDFLQAVPHVRLTEPYDGYISKSSPDYYGYDDVSSVVTDVYQKFKHGASDAFEFSGDREEFRFKILPILEDLSLEEKCELALSYGLEGKSELGVISLDKDEYEDWKESDESSAESSTQDSFMSW